MTPALFVSHGAPTIALSPEGDYALALGSFGRKIAKPRGIVVFSAHFQASGPVRVTASKRPEIVHDFGGFPDALYRLGYDAPGSPALAGEVAALLGAKKDEQRGWDHGVWIPLRYLYPDASIPVVSVSMSFGATPGDLLEIGKALAPLRASGVLLVGSGGIVHNLRRLHFDDQEAPVDSWAAEFESWVRARLDPIDKDALLAYREKAPGASLAVPTTEHFDPLFVVLGSLSKEERIADVHRGFEYGNLSMLSFAFSA
jgi:4,5-DOPA dioxygenase extradiol